jgi:hypothetical protein
LIPIFTLTSQDKAYEQGVIDTYLSQWYYISYIIYYIIYDIFI